MTTDRITGLNQFEHPTGRHLGESPLCSTAHIRGPKASPPRIGRHSGSESAATARISAVRQAPPASGIVESMTDEMTDQAHAILSANRYAVLGTATPAGEPWVSPVYFVNAGLDALLWLSRPSARHSELIALNPRTAVTVFDSSVPMGGATAFYALATAGLCPDDELATQLELFSTRSVAVGFPAWRPEQVTGEAALRLYRADITEAWLLPATEGPERRIPLFH